MDEITNTGDGLGIIIDCDHQLHHDWMSFVSWYSIRKNLPDAQVLLVCPRGIASPKHIVNLFVWTHRCGVKLVYYRGDKVPGLFSEPFLEIIIPSDTMAVRTYDSERVGPAVCQSDDTTTFASYREGCGRFLLSEWINKRGNPFKNAMKKYRNDNVTVNELKVLSIWERSYPLYMVL